jgi:RNA polymerase sigma-70 factor, ECF subfamily
MPLPRPTRERAYAPAETDPNPSGQPSRAADGFVPAPDFARRIEGEIPFLRRTVRRWHGEKADADDLVQDTLAEALANAHLWRPGTNLRAWLFTIMRNEFFAATAKSNRSVSALKFIAAAELGQAADTRETRLILRDVDVALGRLPERQRTTLVLVGVEGKSYEEVAKTMGTSVGAIRCDLARARDRLRAAVHTVDDRSPFARRRPAPVPFAAVAQRAFGSIPPAPELLGGD